MRESGIPTTDAELRAAWEREAQDQGSTLSNTSAWSPFWRIITALVTKPVLWLLEFISGTVLPNFFVKTATGKWLDMLAWAVNIARKIASSAQGQLLFTRAGASGTLEVPAGTRVQSPSINGQVYEVVTIEARSFADGQSQLEVPVMAIKAGSGHNLAPGYYAILPEPVPGVLQVTNRDGWLTQPGADEELDDELRLRVRNQFSAVNQWHTDAVYRALIAAFPGVRPDGIYFDHNAPRGPGSANAYVLFEADAPAQTYLEQINAHIRDSGNHGHGDDLQTFAMPETQHAISLTVWPVDNLSTEQRAELRSQIDQFCRAAFRESTAHNYQPTLTFPQSRFSFSRLGEELHQQFPRITSLKFANDDIVSEMAIPRIQTLLVVFGDED
ncbi:baseplate J/gp47 family protein [Pseudomonas sp. B392_1p]|uniref:baseplate J/gp47 family protein n=1 Tax=Pseudomonas sp. B392_1p TaxID=3457507 RepID=UPI003FD30101